MVEDASVVDPDIQSTELGSRVGSCLEVPPVGHVAVNVLCGLSSFGFDPFVCRLATLSRLRLNVGDDDIRPVFGERQADCPPEAAGPACDDGCLVCE